MKSKSNRYAAALFFAGVAALSAGCASRGLGLEAPFAALNKRVPEQIDVNHYASVTFDEESWEGYGVPSTATSLLGSAGMRTGTPSSTYRAATIAINYWENPSRAHNAGVLVADGLPLLKRADVVEIRLLKTRDSILGFTGTQDAPIAFRLVCQWNGTEKQKLDEFKKCVGALPTHPDKSDAHMVPSGTPFPAHWHDIPGVTMTPRYVMGTDKVRDDAKPLPPR